MTIRFQKSATRGYNLVRDGAAVGRVWRTSRSYNLARPITVHFWRLALDGFPTIEQNFATRTAAAAEAARLLAEVK